MPNQSTVARPLAHLRGSLIRLGRLWAMVLLILSESELKTRTPLVGDFATLSCHNVSGLVHT